MHEEIHASQRWQALARQGARPHRLLWDVPPEAHGHGDERAWEILGTLPSYGICYRELTAAAETADLARSARRQRQTAERIEADLR
jgi:transaldolase